MRQHEVIDPGVRPGRRIDLTRLNGIELEVAYLGILSRRYPTLRRSGWMSSIDRHGIDLIVAEHHTFQVKPGTFRDVLRHLGACVRNNRWIAPLIGEPLPDVAPDDILAAVEHEGGYVSPECHNGLYAKMVQLVFRHLAELHADYLKLKDKSDAAVDRMIQAAIPRYAMALS